MTRLIALVLIVATAGGFTLGWAVLSSPPAAQSPPAPAPRPKDAAEAVRRFPLAPADMRIDRETAAVAADARGRVLLAWASQTGDGARTLFLARSADGGATFEKPAVFRNVPVLRFAAKMKGKDITRTSAVVPRLAVAGEAIHLAWTEATSDGSGVDFLVARTLDGGQTFSEPVRVHGGDAVRPTFTSLSAGPDGALACAWLDHRRHAQHPFCSISAPGGQSFHGESLVYPGPDGAGVCPCCDTDAVRTPAGDTFVAFRNNDDDYRDIVVTRSRGMSGTFEPPVLVSADRWQFEGCPHDGPSLAVSGGKLHVLWMDAHTGKRRVYHAGSDLANLHFTPRALCPEGPGEQGHPRLAAGGGVLHAVWDGSLREEPASAGTKEPQGHRHGARHTGSGRAVLYACAAADGAGFGPARALAPRPGAFQVNPALAVGPDGAVYVAWSEITEGGKSVAFVRVPGPSK